MNWIFWALMSAFFAGATAVLAKVGVTGISSNLATAIRTSVVLVTTWIIVGVSEGSVSFGLLTKRTWIFLGLSGVATALSWLCYFRALQLGQAGQVASLDKLSVVVVVLFSAMFLDEAITAKTLLGVGLIVGGAILLITK